MTDIIIQSLGFDYSKIGFLQQENITQINLASLVSFILHLQLHTLEKGQISQVFILPMDNQERKLFREVKLK